MEGSLRRGRVLTKRSGTGPSPCGSRALHFRTFRLCFIRCPGEGGRIVAGGGGGFVVAVVAAVAAVGGGGGVVVRLF